MINSRHTGMIIWIIKILRRLHDTFYKQNALSLAFRQRVGIISSGFQVNKTVKRRQGEISAANFFEKINLCVTFYIACASIYQNSKTVVW